MSTPLTDRLAAMIEDFDSRYSEEYTLPLLRRIWQSDRWSDYTAFRHTAEDMADELRRLGLQQVEIVDCPADGRTRMQAWTMPLAWEAGQAVLKIVSPQAETLCDRSVQPLSSAMWSEPTPPEGLRGPLVVVDDPDAVPPAERPRLRGAFLLTGKSGRGPLKVFAHEVGAAAVVSHFVAHEERHPDAVGWSNGWSDDSGAWALKASDCRMTGFQISPGVGRRLRGLVAKGPVICEARVGGRVGEGTLPVVTGLLPGESDQEILLSGHLYEIGANDNASGCAAMIEVLRLMAALPRPRRSVRILLTSECYGTYAFYTMRPELIGRTLTGMNLDCVAEKETAERPAQWYRTSEACPGAIDNLFRACMKLSERFPGALPAREFSHSLSDNMLCDPATAVPMICFMKAPWHWHTSADDWSGIDANAVRRAVVAAAVTTRWLAEAGADDADALAELVAADADAEYPEGGSVAGDRRTYFLSRARQRALWTRKLGARNTNRIAGALPEFDAASFVKPEDGDGAARRTVPVRSYWGAPTFDGIPMSDRQGLADPRWNMPLVTAAYWADGRRTVAEIAALVRTEFDQPQGELLKFFEVLQRGGLVDLKSV
jgi:hypothetical protein